MRFSGIRQVVAGIAMIAMPVLVGAQQPATQTPPPKLEKLDEIPGSAAAPRARAPVNNQRITEKREQGQVTEVTVANGGGNTYTVKPNAYSAGDAQTTTVRPAQWKVLEFDWNREEAEKKRSASASAPQAPLAAPPSIK